MIPVRDRFPGGGSRVLLVGLVAAWLAAPARVRAAGEGFQVAVLLGADVGGLRRAAAGVAKVPGVHVHSFELFKGTLEVDRAVQSLRHFPFDAVVALGKDAHEFARSERIRRGYAATMVPESGEGDADLVPFEPGVEDWARFLAEVAPEGSKVAALSGSPSAASRLAALGTALGTRGRQLSVVAVGGRTSFPEALRKSLAGARVLLLLRDPALLERVEQVRHLLKEAHRTGVAVVSFTPGLLDEGAALSLEIPYEVAGERAARKALGLPPPERILSVGVNRDRAQRLGLSLPVDLERRLGTSE